MSGDPEVLSALESLRGLGVRLGIDDFGTGYSSIARLQQLPVDTVKIDRSLVSDIGGSAPAFELLRAVFGLLRTSPELDRRRRGRGDRTAVGAPAGAGLPLGAGLPPGAARPARRRPALRWPGIARRRDSP